MNNIPDQIDLIDIYITFYPKEARYIFFPNIYGSFSNIAHMVGHKTSLNKFNKTEIISSTFSDHNSLTLKTKLKKKTQNHSNSWRLNNGLLSNKRINNEIKEEMKKFLETNENEHTATQNLWDTAKAVLRGKFIAIP